MGKYPLEELASKNNKNDTDHTMCFSNSISTYTGNERLYLGNSLHDNLLFAFKDFKYFARNLILFHGYFNRINSSAIELGN